MRFAATIAANLARTIGCLGFLLTLAAAGVVAQTLEFTHSRSWLNALLAIVAAAATLFFLRALMIGIRDATIVRIVPYFQSPLRLGTASPFSRGAALARHYNQLDQLAIQLRVPPISTYGFHDDAAGQRVQWHPSPAGLQTITALKPHAAHDPQLLDDLTAIESALQEATRKNVPFCFILRSGTDAFISPVEMDRREGSFW